MHQWKFLQPLDTMKRICRQELVDQLDSIIEEIDTKDVGMIIQDFQGNDEFVICPARWVEYGFDSNFGCILISAIRYALPRATSMPSIVADFTRNHLKILDNNTIQVAIDNIDQELSINNAPRSEVWISLKHDLQQQLANRKEVSLQNVGETSL